MTAINGVHAEVTGEGGIYVTCVQNYKLGHSHAKRISLPNSSRRLEETPITRIIKMPDIKCLDSGPDQDS